MPKSKTQQYISRREAGQSPEEARKRSYLKQSGAWKAEQKYLKAAIALEAAQARERASQEAQERASQEAQEAAQEAEKARQKDEAARSRRVAETPKTQPKGYRSERCKYCQSDYECRCRPPELGEPPAWRQRIDEALSDPLFSREQVQRAAQYERSHLGLPGEWITGWKNQLESGMDTDGLTLSDLNGAVWTKETGLVTEGDRREADFRAEQDRQRAMEDSFDPWHARMRAQGVL